MTAAGLLYIFKLCLGPNTLVLNLLLIQSVAKLELRSIQESWQEPSFPSMVHGFLWFGLS